MILHPNEVAWCVIQVGFSVSPPAAGGDSDAVIMTAICLTETAASSRNGPDAAILARSATGDHVGNWDAGIAQVSNKFHGDKLQAAAARGEDWRDPRVLLRIAKKIRDDAGGFTPWAVFNSGSYKNLLPDARIAIKWPFQPTHVLG